MSMRQGSERILVVDDDVAMRELLVNWLCRGDYQCVTASTAADAVRVLQQEKFDLILLDIGLPGKSGLDLLSEINYRYPEAAVVMVTGHEDLATAVLAMQGGAYDFLTKPVPPGLLILRVEKALERRAVLLYGRPPQSDMGEQDRAVEAPASRENAGPDFDTEVDSLADIAQGIAEIATENIKTGEMALDEKLSGGLPRGSLTLIEGASSTGKSVLCQHLIFGNLMTKGGVACYSSEFTFKSLLTQMSSIGLEASRCPQGAQLTVEPLEDPLGDEDADPLLAELAQTLESVPDSFDLIVIDAITNLAAYSGERAILSFFSACKRICAAGKTIIVVAHSSAFDERMSVRLRALCDGYLSLLVENIGTKLMNSLEVRKILNAQLATGNIVFFDVEPGMGIRVNPFSRARV